jgi:hypothetical protein
MRTTPDLLPVLSRGKHRTPRRGACFMEYASYLAGETWSDHPACTDPALASLARMVNDCSSDAARGRLVILIPSVIGLTGEGTITGIHLAARAASAALPIASEGRQRALAAGLLRCDDILASYGESPASAGRTLIRTALAHTPGASSWARDFLQMAGSLNPRSIPMMSDAIIRTAVVGIADACVQDPDERLRELLAAAIEDCALSGRPTTVDEPARELQPTT